MSIPRLIQEAYEQNLITQLQVPVWASLQRDMEPRPMTPQEIAELEQHRRSTEERSALRRQARADFRSSLAAVTDPLARAILDLHHEDGDAYWSDCQGCDFSGYEGDPPEWPCRTVRLIASRFDIKEWE